MAAQTNPKARLTIYVFFIVLAFIGTAHAKIIYVDDDAPGANDGSSWTDAYNFLQDALAAAASGGEIRVAQGTYKPDQGAGITPGNREATFQLINGVTLKGAYAGLGEPDPNVRNIDLYETVLSGDIGIPDDNSDNSYHVVTGSGTDKTAVLDGFTITGGNANSLDPHDQGGGMFSQWGSPTLSNCTFINNSAKRAAGMYNERSRPKLINCTFSQNSADYYSGGGMFNYEGSNAELLNCTFIDNMAGQAGGAIYNWNSSPTMTNCAFSGNSAEGDGGVIAIYYGSLGGFIPCKLINCTFTGNSSGQCGGGILFLETNLILNNCTFAANSALSGNALACSRYPSNVEITNCIFWDGGDEIWNDADSTITITYSDVQEGWPGEGNIDVDPCFVDTGYWDGGGVWIDGDYHLLSDSPCIDAGDPNYIPEPNETDLDGKPRVIGARIDMGAYEYHPPILAEAKIVPRTINLASKGKWISCSLWLPEGYNVADIDPNSVLLEDEIEAKSVHLNEQKQVAIAKFRREEVKDFLEACRVELTITGRLTDGTFFEATDVVRVLNKGRASLPASASGSIALNQYVGTCWDPNECPCQPYGDATCDGLAVNFADLFALKAAWGASAPWTPPFCCADFNHDGKVNLGDLLVMKNRWCHICDPGTGNQNCPQ